VPLHAVREEDRASVARSGNGQAARCNPRGFARGFAARRRDVDRAAKRELIDHLHGVLKDTGVVVVAHNTGLVAAQSAEFRKRVKEAGGSVKVAKNKLAQLAFKDTDAEKLSDLMKGPTILAFSKDPIAAAKAAVTYAKGNEKLVILGGAMGKTLLDANGVKALADLPSLDELRATLIGLLNAPATKIARTVKEPGAKLARVIQAKASKGEEAAA
jgi:large subunit ribosomal protein L10